MLKAVYTVHSAVREEIPMVLDVMGRDTAVRVPGLVVELVGDFESHTFRFVPEDMEAALAMYVPGAKIELELNAAE